MGLALTLQPLASACSTDACGDAATECVDGRTLRTCGGSVDAVGQARRWSTQACPADAPYCVVRATTPNLSPYDRATRATCAPSAEPAPECAGIATGTICNAGRVDRCSGGFLFAGQACSGACLASSSGAGSACAVCASPEAAPDPGCSAPARSVCSGRAIHRCECGFRLELQKTCDADHACVTAPLGPNLDTFCAIGTSLDPRCAGPQTDETYCDGTDVLVQCHLGHAVERVTCKAGCNPDLGVCRL